ncbi:MAG: PH domain-containing protein [Candidatus Bathyarchaeota archaeon]|nr:PH domain-containing protein [Candidatus Bathyarchaeota archaeon]
MSVFKDVLDPNEDVIWEAKPDTNAFMLDAFGGYVFALIFLGGSLLWIFVGVPWYMSPLVITIPAAIILFVVPPIWQYKKLAHVGYMITNQRLLAKTGIHDHDVWFIELEKIKDVLVKIGIVDRLFGTGKLYPITPAYPYEPKIRGYSKRGGHKLKKVYNLAEQKYEEVTELQLYLKTKGHPRLEGLREPYAVKKLLKEVIFGAGTNYVNCKYCYARYDLNKEGKCPHCGGTQSQDYSNIT